MGGNLGWVRFKLPKTATPAQIQSAIDKDAPHVGTLDRLTPDEAAIYPDLRHDRHGRSVRLEQERIGFGWVCRASTRRTSQR